MAVTRHQLTGDFDTIVGGDFGKSAKAWLTTNLAAGEALVDLAANKIQPGSIELTLTNGAFSQSLIATDSADTNIASGDLQYRVIFSYVDPYTRTRQTWDSDYFALTADADLSDIAGTIEAPLSWRSAFISDMEAIQAATEAARDDTITISGLTGEDAAVGALIEGTGGAGPITRAALSASYEGKWKPSTAYAVGVQVTSPYGALVSCRVAHTSGAQYDSAKWNKLSPNNVEWPIPADRLTPAPGATILSGFAEFVMDPDGTKVHQFAHVVGSTPGIWHAVSTDGENFTWDAAPVLTVGSETWENLTVGVPCVFYDSGQWHMFYRGTGNGAQTQGIGYARAAAPEGPWARVQSNPSYVIVGGSGGEAGPGRIIKVGSTYYMHTSSIFSDYHRQVDVRTSTDLVNWTLDPKSPVWTNGRFCNCIWKEGEFYYSLVPHYRKDGNPAGQPADIELWRSTTPQFYPETRDFLGTVLKCGPSGTWSSSNLDTPTVLVTDITKSAYPAFTGGKPWIYYAGMNASGYWFSGVTKLEELPKIAMLPDAPSQRVSQGSLAISHVSLGAALTSSLAANQSLTGMTRVGTTLTKSFVMPKAGSVVGLILQLSSARSAGSITVSVTDLAGGALSGAPSVTINSGASTRGVSYVEVGACPLVALQEVRVSITTTGWAPTGIEAMATVLVAYA